MGNIKYIIAVYFVIVIVTMILLYSLGYFKNISYIFLPNGRPNGSPIHGSYIVTAYFHDPRYFKIFHHQHEGIDLVPKNASNTFLYSTINGIGYNNYDVCGGNSVIIKNLNYIIYLGHIKVSYIHSGDEIHYGEKVAQIGETGMFGVCVTGVHVHYQIYKNEDNNWVIVNPYPYML